MTSRRPTSTKPTIDPVRSRIMRAVPQSHSKPEVRVRRVLHRLGYRFRLHVKGLPGTPDIILPKHRTVIFVHGCYWHRHEECRYSTTPKTRTEFWKEKFNRNVERDARKREELEELGWRVITIWECETKNDNDLEARLRSYLTTKI